MGERMPGAKPAVAAWAACRGSLEDGRPLMKSRPRPIQRRPEAATSRSATQTTTVPSAAARWVARWPTRSRCRASQPGRSGSSDSGGAEAARPVEGAAEGGHRRGDEGDADDEPGQDADRQAGPERAERRLGRGQQGRRAGGHHQPGGEDDRRELRRRVPHGLAAAAAASEALPGSGQVEDRVVGDDPQQQDHHQGVDLRGRGEPELAPGERHEPRADDVGHARREQRHQGRQQRPEGDAQDQRHEDDRRDLDGAEALRDRVLLRDARRHRARHAHHGRVRMRQALGRVGARQVDLLPPRRLRREVQIGDRRGRLLVPLRPDPRVVHERQRPEQPPSRLLRQVHRRRDRLALDGGGEAGRVPLHHGDPADRLAEDARRARLRRDRRRVPRRVVGQAARLGRQRRQVEHREHRRGDPRERDQRRRGARDDPRERSGHGVARGLGGGCRVLGLHAPFVPEARARNPAGRKGLLGRAAGATRKQS